MHLAITSKRSCSPPPCAVRPLSHRHAALPGALYQRNLILMGLGTEIVGGDYARIRVIFTDPAKGADGDFFCANDGDIRSPKPSTLAWGTVTHFAIYDALAGAIALPRPTPDFPQHRCERPVLVLSGDLKVTLS